MTLHFAGWRILRSNSGDLDLDAGCTDRGALKGVVAVDGQIGDYLGRSWDRGASERRGDLHAVT